MTFGGSTCTRSEWRERVAPYHSLPPSLPLATPPLSHSLPPSRHPLSVSAHATDPAASSHPTLLPLVCVLCLLLFVCASVCHKPCLRVSLLLLCVRVIVSASSFLSRSATAIQSSIRGFFGRKRLRAMRGIQQAAKLAMESADILKPRVLEELAALPVPPPAVASVVQCALILLAPLERLYTHAGHVFVDPEEAAKAKAASKIASQHIDSDSDSGDDANADTVRRSPPLLPPSLSVHGSCVLGSDARTCV